MGGLPRPFWRVYKAYRKRIWSRAFLDTLGIFGFNRATALLGGLTVISWVVLWQIFKWSWRELSSEILPAVALGVVVVGVGVIFLGLRLKITPALIDREQRDKIALLEKDIEPRIEVKFDAGCEDYERTEPLICTGQAKQRLFCIGVHNPGNEMLHHCAVTLTKMEPKGAFLPIRLKLHKETPLPARGTVLYTEYDFAQEFELRPHDTEFVDIAAYSETRSDQQIELRYATEGKKNSHISRWVDARSEHVLYIEVNAEKGRGVMTRFKMWVDQTENRLHCQRLL